MVENYEEKDIVVETVNVESEEKAVEEAKPAKKAKTKTAAPKVPTEPVTETKNTGVRKLSRRSKHM